MSFVVRWVAGPDAGAVSRLRPGRQLVGRSHRADVRCDDPTLRRRHAVLEVTGTGVNVAPFATDAPVLVDGVRLREPARVQVGTWIEVGHSVLVVEHDVVDHRAGGARRSAADLLPGAAAAVVAGIAAVQLGQPSLAVAGGVGLALPTVSWTAQLAVRRRRRWPLTLGLAADRGAPPTAATTTLRPGSVVALTGQHALAVARSLVLQALEAPGVDPLCLVSTTGRGCDWDWCGPFAVTERQTVEGRAIGGRAIGSSAAVLDVRATGETVPVGCTALLATDDSPFARWVPDLHDRRRAAPHECRVRIVGVGEMAAFRRAQALATTPRSGRPGCPKTIIVVR